MPAPNDPATSADPGLTVLVTLLRFHGVSADPAQACSSLWDQLQNDFCSERSKVKLEDLPPKPGAGKEDKPK